VSTAYSLGYCEMREMWEKNVMSLSREELNRAQALIARDGLRVTSIASPIFKYTLPEVPAHPDGALVFHSTFTERDNSKLLRECGLAGRFFLVPECFGLGGHFSCFPVHPLAQIDIGHIGVYRGQGGSIPFRLLGKNGQCVGKSLFRFRELSFFGVGDPQSCLRMPRPRDSPVRTLSS